MLINTNHHTHHACRTLQHHYVSQIGRLSFFSFVRDFDATGAFAGGSAAGAVIGAPAPARTLPYFFTAARLSIPALPGLDELSSSSSSSSSSMAGYPLPALGGRTRIFFESLALRICI